MRQVSPKRHIAKAITWRLVGSIDTFLIAWLISGDSEIGIKIGIVETITKLLLYYVHERIWYHNQIKESRKRHILKTFSWRLVGTIDTILIGWIITGDPFTGLSIGLVEVLTKMVLYYFHERAWYKFNYGIKDRNQK